MKLLVICIWGSSLDFFRDLCLELDEVVFVYDGAL